MKEIIYANADIITLDEKKPFYKNSCILIINGKFKKIGSLDALKKISPRSKIIDLKGKLIMPGLINVHGHLYSSLARGMPVKGSSTNFPQILENIWWKLDKVLNTEEVYYSAIA